MGLGDRVAILLHNRPDYLALFFATARLGAIVVPLNVRLSNPELEHIVRHAEPKVVVSENAFGDALEHLARTLPGVELLDADGGSAPATSGHLPPWGDEVRTPPPVEHFPDRLPVALCYTSGTTGRPKGVVLTHDGVKHLCFSIVAGVGLTRKDRALMVLPLCFTGGLFPATMPFLNLGCAIVLGREFTPRGVLEAIAEHRPTYMPGVPTMFKAMLDDEAFPSTPMDSLRFLLSGGAPCPLPIIEAYAARGVDVLQGYGLTETSGFNAFLAPEDAVAKKGSVGKALLYSTVAVVDDDLEPCAADEVGQVVISGPIVMAGYWRDEEATEASVRDGWLLTGDLGRLDADGYLFIVDRLKDMIISGGLNVYPAEVEEVLCRLPDVAEAAVIGLPDERWGEAVCAVVRLRAGSAVTEQDLAAHCAANLADYKRPRRFILRDEELPKNASGKLLKRTLRATYAG